MPITKGPWEVISEPKPDLGTVWHWIAPKDWSTRVARVVAYEGEEAEQLANAQAIAALPELVEALQSIEQYGSDTLSGNAQGSSDAAWYRDGVREMRNRARALLTRLEDEA